MDTPVTLKESKIVLQSCICVHGQCEKVGSIFQFILFFISLSLFRSESCDDFVSLFDNQTTVFTDSFQELRGNTSAQLSG